MQDLCGLQGIYDLFNCKTPEFSQIVFPKRQKNMLQCSSAISYGRCFWRYKIKIRKLKKNNKIAEIWRA